MRIAELILPIIIGFLLDCLLGDPYTLPHPVRAVGILISLLEKVMRKLFPKNKRLGGTLMAVCVILITSGIAFAVLFVCKKINIWLKIIAESIMCYYLLAARCLKDESMKVYSAAHSGDVEGARKAVSMIVGRDTAVLDRDGIIRAAVETVAENTSDGITAPVFYITLGGGVLGFFYKAVNTMDSMVGYTNEKYIDFGRFAAKLDDVLNYIPSRLTALIMIVSAQILGMDGKNAYKIWKRDRRKHASPNSAQTESVCAGALDVRLAGDAYYFGELHKKEYIGDDIRPIENGDIVRVNRLMYCTTIISIVISVAVRALLFGLIFKI